MTFRRLGGFACLATFAIVTCGCGAATDPLANNGTSTNDTADTNTNTNTDTTADPGSQVVMPSSEPSITDCKNAFVISVPIVGESLAADVAAHFTVMAAPLISGGWGSGRLSFDVPGMDWLTVTRAALTDAAGRPGLVRTYFLPIGSLRAGPLSGNLLDIAPAPGMSTVGVLPIVFITTDFEGFPASGMGLEVGLWSQQTTCPTCAYTDATRYQHGITPLISSVEIRQLREQGLWNDRIVVIIAKAGVWWAQSEEASSRVRNWMMLNPTGGAASQVRCLTSGGNWPA